MVEIKNRTFSNIPRKKAANTFTLTVIKKVVMGFKNNSFKRKISEALLIKEINPSVNVQEKSIELKFFN